MHSLYSLVRTQEFMDDIKSIVKNKNVSSIDNIVNEHDFDEFKEYILSGKYNIEADLRNSENSGIESLLLYKLLNNGWYKGGKLLLSDIYHSNNFQKNNLKIKKYLNYNNNVIEVNDKKNGLIFFGIDLNKLNSTGESIIENFFLNSSHFNEIKNKMIIYYCVKFNYFKFLSLILKYRSNDIGIVDGINYNENDSKMAPLFYLVRLDYCNDDWIRLLLSFKNIDTSRAKEIISNKEWLDIIENPNKKDSKDEENEYDYY